MSEQYEPDVPEEHAQHAGIRPKATVEFTLHVHLDDGTTKDIKCVGTVMPEQPKEVANDNLGT